jgi:hypothetical protein
MKQKDIFTYISILLLFQNCQSKQIEKDGDYIRLKFRPSFRLPFSVFEIKSDGIKSTFKSKIYIEKNPATGEGKDSIYHQKSVEIEPKQVELLINEIKKQDFKHYKSKNLIELDGIGIDFKYISMSKKDTFQFHINSAYRKENPVESDILLTFFNMVKTKLTDSVTVVYSTKLDSMYFGKLIR